VAELADHLARISRAHATLDAVLALPDGDLIDALVPAGPRRRRMRSLHRAYDDGPLTEAAWAAGLSAICWHHAAYPAQLRELTASPPLLFVSDRDRLVRLTSEPAVAVVGARRASGYGLEMARALGRGLSAAGVTVVSGMALGVDSAAQAGALEAGALTLAVLAGGADVPYPATKRRLHRRLRECAVVASEMPPGFPARRWCFPARNRIIAALAGLTVVVEAAERSGALITARVARDLGREVGALPGAVTSRLASGTNALIRDGAHLIAGPQDALDVVCGVGVRQVPAGPDSARLGQSLRTLLDAVRDGRGSPAALATSGEEARAVLAGLAELELRGYLRRTPGGGYEARA
jgi:DNA processing protein